MSDPDYDNMSVEELQKIASGGADPEFDFMSEAELLRIANPPGMIESGARGLAQGATLGFADEIAGGAEALFTDKPYAQARDESRANFKRAKDANPNTFLTGEIAGGVATAFVPMGAAATSVRGAAAAGGLLGATAGLGGSEAKNIDGQAQDMLMGLGLGYAGGAAGKAIADKIPSVSEKAGLWMKKRAEERAVKSLGGSKKAMESLQKVPGAEERLGRTLLDSKVVTPLAGKAKMASRLDDVAAGKVDELTGELDRVSGMQNTASPEDALRLEAAKFSPTEAAEALKGQLREQYSHIPEEILEPQLQAIDKWLNKTGRMDIKDVQAFKTQMQKFIKDGSYLKSNPGLAQETLKGIRGTLKTGIERNADEAAGLLGEQGGKIKSVNQDLGGIFQGQDMLEDAVARGSKNRTISLTDYITGNAGAAAMGPQGMALGLANKVVREKGSQMSAVALDKASKFLLKSPRMQQLANTNPKAFRALANDVARRFDSKDAYKAAGFNPTEPGDDQQAREAFLDQ